MSLKRLVYGVGLNDVPGGSGTHGRNPFYVAWHGMLKRCYAPKYLARYPAYEGCTVCEEWLKFSVFKAWMELQSWEGMVLDKDLLLPGNRAYGPDTCMFIPAWVNNFLANLVPKKRDLPMGVALYKGLFVARYSQKDKPIIIGRFNTAEQAHIAYSQFRLPEIRQRIARYCESDDANQVVCGALQRLYETEANRVENLHESNPPSAIPRRQRSRSVISGKLTVEQVRDIREAHSAHGETRKSLAARYGVSRRAIDDLVTWVTWKIA